MRARLARTVCGTLLVAVGLACAEASQPYPVRHVLAEFETGATRPTFCAADRKVGTKREVSRFQILPSVWQEYSRSRDYQNPEVAWQVAARILSDREREFREATGRTWEPLDLYIMWNAPGHYRKVGWNRSRVSRVVMERAQRFANLMEERTRLASASPTRALQ
jgi:hypothetical protein